MSDSPVLLEARGLSKQFKLYRNPNHRLLEWLSFGRTPRHRVVTALHDIDVELRRGECLGVIGANGSGKSTLLKILSGSLSPTTGTVRSGGRVFALIELSTGFNRDITGRQNISFAGMMLGLDPDYIASRTNEIIEFADLGDYIDEPMRFYSSGMFARLGFSMFAFLDPDVLMVDEVLSVGDARFRRAAFELMESRIRSRAHAVVLVSHSVQSIVRLCDRVLWLDQGAARLTGESNEVVNAYLEFSGERPLPAPDAPVSPADDADEATRIPSSRLLHDGQTTAADTDDSVRMLAIWLESWQGRQLEAAHAHAGFIICCAVRFDRPVRRPRFVVRLCNPSGDTVAVCDTEQHQTPVTEAAAGTALALRCTLVRGVASGIYGIEVTCQDGAGAPALAGGRASCRLHVVGPDRVEAPFNLFNAPTLHPLATAEDDASRAGAAASTGPAGSVPPPT